MANDRFLAWLAVHAEALVAGATESYRGQSITVDTPLRNFEATVSLVLCQPG